MTSSPKKAIKTIEENLLNQIISAVLNEDLNKFKNLITKENLNFISEKGSIVIDFIVSTAHNKSLDMLSHILDLNANIVSHKEDFENPLVKAIALKKYSLANKLIDKNFDLNLKKNQEQLPLLSILKDMIEKNPSDSDAKKIGIKIETLLTQNISSRKKLGESPIEESQQKLPNIKSQTNKASTSESKELLSKDTPTTTPLLLRNAYKHKKNAKKFIPRLSSIKEEDNKDLAI